MGRNSSFKTQSLTSTSENFLILCGAEHASAQTHPLVGCKSAGILPCLFGRHSRETEKVLYLFHSRHFGTFTLSIFRMKLYLSIFFPVSLSQSLTDSQTCQLSSALSGKNDLKAKNKALKDTEAKAGTDIYL